MTKSERRTVVGPMPTRPKRRNALERAERIADDLAGMREDDEWHGWLLARFRGANESDVVRMWKAGTNEDGKPLSRVEWHALHERWCQLFGFAPPTDGVAVPSPQEPEPADTTTIDMKEVVRLTGLSESTIERRYKAGKFSEADAAEPTAHRLERGKVKAWLAEREAGLGS